MATTRSPIHHMTAVRYYDDGRPWDEETIEAPAWSDVEAAIRRMDNDLFPIVQLNTDELPRKPQQTFNTFVAAGRSAR